MFTLGPRSQAMQAAITQSMALIHIFFPFLKKNCQPLVPIFQKKISQNKCCTVLYARLRSLHVKWPPKYKVTQIFICFQSNQISMQLSLYKRSPKDFIFYFLNFVISKIQLKFSRNQQNLVKISLQKNGKTKINDQSFDQKKNTTKFINKEYWPPY